MFAGIGIALVLIAVLGGFLMEGGNLHVLIQPAEYVIIFGAALGAFFIASPGGMVPVVFKSVGSIFGSGAVSKAHFLNCFHCCTPYFRRSARTVLYRSRLTLKIH